MNRLFFEIDRNDVYYRLESNRGINRERNTLPARSVNTMQLPRDVLEKRFQTYNGQTGSLKYTQDTSIKSTPIMMDKYGNEEFGRNTILRDTANIYPVSVSGYKLANKFVSKVPSSDIKALRIERIY